MLGARSRLMTLALPCVAILVVPSVATAQEESGDAPPNGEPEQVEAEELGIDGSGATVPWRAEELVDGSVQIVIGGIDNVPIDPEAVAIASEVPPSSDVSTAASWSCNMHHNEYQTVKSGSNLQGVAHVDCTGVSRHRVDWLFQRSSWSGYRSYTNEVVGGWVSTVTNASTKYAYCGTGGTYDYKLRYQSVVDVDGSVQNGPWADNLKTRQTCGTGVS